MRAKRSLTINPPLISMSRSGGDAGGIVVLAPSRWWGRCEGKNSIHYRVVRLLQRKFPPGSPPRGALPDLHPPPRRRRLRSSFRRRRISSFEIFGAAEFL